MIAPSRKNVYTNIDTSVLVGHTDGCHWRKKNVRVAGIREFRNRAPEFVKSKDIVFITRHGKLVSILVPLNDPEELPVELRRELLERFGEAISRHLDERGVSEKQVIRDFEAWKKKGQLGGGRR